MDLEISFSGAWRSQDGLEAKYNVEREKSIVMTKEFDLTKPTPSRTNAIEG